MIPRTSEFNTWHTRYKLLIVAGLMQLTITKYERLHFWEIGTHQLIRADIQQARTRKADFNIMQQRSNSDVYL